MLQIKSVCVSTTLDLVRIDQYKLKQSKSTFKHPERQARTWADVRAGVARAPARGCGYVRSTWGGTCGCWSNEQHASYGLVQMPHTNTSSANAGLLNAQVLNRDTPAPTYPYTVALKKVMSKRAPVTSPFSPVTLPAVMRPSWALMRLWASDRPIPTPAGLVSLGFSLAPR